MSEIKLIFSEAGINISSYQLNQFKIMTDFMLEYNKNVNLTSITAHRDIFIKHYLDSVMPLTLTDFPEGSTVADVGTGAGFPAIPMLIMRPDLKFTLIDSLAKRTSYLKQLKSKLNINCEIITARSEDFAQANREKYDFVVSRAVARLPILAELTVPLLKVSGRLCALKTPTEDITDLENFDDKLGVSLDKLIDYTIADKNERRLVILKKISQTPPKYPRNFAQIKKNPL